MTAPKHKLTKDEARRGGWARARAWAAWRRESPSPAETAVREFLTMAGVEFFSEYEIVHDTGMPQFFDIFVPAWNMAIEVDGSNGWHEYNGDFSKNLKMFVYDELKVRYCEEKGIAFVAVKNVEGLEGVIK